jgi:hypothetical protein
MNPESRDHAVYDGSNEYHPEFYRELLREEIRLLKFAKSRLKEPHTCLQVFVD